MATLDISKNGYGVEVLSWYLWGQEKAPSPSEINSNKWINRKENITLDISAVDYMKYVDKYTSVANFSIFEKFFDPTISHPAGAAGTIIMHVTYTKAQMESVGAKINSNGYYELNIQQMGDIIYGKGNNPFFIDNQYKELSTNISHYTLDVNSDNYAERAFVFGSTKMTFTTGDVRFLINATTFEPEYIDNLQIKPKEDNFDFEGGGTTAKVANHYLNKITDPSNIGKTITLRFIETDKIDHIKISKDKFNKLKEIYNKNVNTTPNLDAFEKYFNNIIVKSGVIDYIDDNGKLVMFGSNGADTMQDTKAKNLDFDEYLFSELGGINNPHKNKLKNGITYIGGKGSDTIIGTDYDDILYSNDKSLSDDNSSDILQGGKGYDTYYANDKDIITDSDGKGKVYLNNSENYLKGGRFIENLSNGNVEIYKSNDDLITYEYNTSTKVLKANELIINDFDNEELEINLQKDINYEFAILSDTTGSMSGAINSVKSQAKELVNLAFSKNDKSRIGIFGYNDPNVETFTNLTNDKNAIISAINSLHATDGGDTPEMTYKGIINAAKSNWGEYSQKRLFIFGDAPAKDPENRALALSVLKPNKKALRSYATLNALYKDDFSNLNNIEIYAIQIGNDVQTKKEFEELANFTGGKYINSSYYESVADAIFDSMNDGTQKSETIIGNDKNNIIEGKGGDDILQGNLGSDTYIFKPNFDKDTIIETNPKNIDKNIIDLSEFSIKDMKFQRKNSDFIISLIQTKKDSKDKILDKISHNLNSILSLKFNDLEKLNFKDEIKDQITIKDFFNADELKISTIKFSDFLLDESAMKFISKSKNKNQNLNILSNDFINENLGDDLYIFTKNSGKISLQDNSIFSYNDRIIFSDFSKKDAKFFKEKDDLIVKFNDDNILKIKDANSLKNRVENFEFKDEILSLKDVNKIVQDLNSYSNDKSANFVEFMGEKNQSNLQLFS